MALSKSSVLHYWDALFGPNALVGGDPVFARDSAGSLVDRARILRSVIRGVPRTEWVTLDSIRRPALLMESARTNILTYNRDISQWTLVGTAAATPGQPDARGSAAAYLLNAVAANDRVVRAVTFATTACCVSVILKKGTAAITDVELYNVTTATVLQRVKVEWSAAGVPTVSVTAGTGLAFSAVELTGGYYLIQFYAPNTVPANSWQIRIWIAGGSGSAAGTGTVYFDSAQIEEATTPSSMIDTTAASAARLIDNMYWKNPVEPQACALYVAWLDQLGLISGRSHFFVEIGQISVTTNNSILVYLDGSNIRSFHSRSGASAEASVAFTGLARGDFAEAVGVFPGAGTQRIIAARNKGTPVAGSIAALSHAAAWQQLRIALNGYGTAFSFANQYLAVKLVKLSDMTNVPGVASNADVLSELRNFVLSPTGDVL